MSKGQVSIELVIIFSLAMIIFISVFAISEGRFKASSEKKTQLFAQVLATKIAGEIDSVYFAGKGTTKAFFVPDSLKDGTNSTVNVYADAHLVEIVWSREHTRSYTKPFSGALNHTVLNISGSVMLSNSGSVIIS